MAPEVHTERVARTRSDIYSPARRLEIAASGCSAGSGPFGIRTVQGQEPPPPLRHPPRTRPPKRAFSFCSSCLNPICRHACRGAEWRTRPPCCTSNSPWLARIPNMAASWKLPLQNRQPSAPPDPCPRSYTTRAMTDPNATDNGKKQRRPNHINVVLNVVPTPPRKVLRN